MRLLTVVVLLCLSVGTNSYAGFNFVKRYMTFFRIRPLFKDWEVSHRTFPQVCICSVFVRSFVRSFVCLLACLLAVELKDTLNLTISQAAIKE